MTGFLVGSRLIETVVVSDKASGAIVDPGTFTFTLKAPDDSGLAFPIGTYTWNGTIWTSTESVIATPARAALGTFTLSLTVPYVNTSGGTWVVGWVSTPNGSNLGGGSGETTFSAVKTGVLAG